MIADAGAPFPVDTLYIVGGLLALMVLQGLIFAARYVKVGPNQALIVSGARRRRSDGRVVGFRVVKGGGTFVWPVIEQAQWLSLELTTAALSFPPMRDRNGVQGSLTGSAGIKVGGSDTHIARAAELFLSKTPREMAKVAEGTLEGHVRAVLGRTALEDFRKERDRFAAEVAKSAAEDFSRMGLELVTLSLDG